MWEEFKKFAMRGNVIDMAVGIIIGAAFGKIVSSFVNDVLMPPLSIITGGIDFSDKILILKAATEQASAITLNWGAFINAILDFLIIAVAVFILIKQMNRLTKKEEVKSQKPSAEVALLTEIRDTLQKK